MKSRNIEYLPALDHIRAYAALLIVFYHGFQRIAYELAHRAPLSYQHWPKAGNPLTALIIEGHTAVALFMVLSGFIFTIGTYGQDVDYFKFIRNRLLRTYPLFLLLLFVGIYAFPKSFSLSAFFQTVLPFANVETILRAGAFTAMFWAVAVEWQFYLLFPFLLKFLNQKGTRFLWGLLSVFLLMRVLSWLQGANLLNLTYTTLAGRMDQFLIGMGAGVYYRTRFRPGRMMNLGFAGNFALTLLALHLFNAWGGWPTGRPFKMIWPTAEGLLWAVFILTYLSVSRKIPALISRCIASAGIISYSVYLMHYIVIDIFIAKGWIIPFPGLDPSWSAVLNTALIILPSVLSVSALTYAFVEKPFLDLRGVYKK